jgi:hypothetical protein
VCHLCVSFVCHLCRLWVSLVCVSFICVCRSFVCVVHLCVSFICVCRSFVCRSFVCVAYPFSSCDASGCFQLQTDSCLECDGDECEFFRRMRFCDDWGALGFYTPDDYADWFIHRRRAIHMFYDSRTESPENQFMRKVMATRESALAERRLDPEYQRLRSRDYVLKIRMSGVEPEVYRIIRVSGAISLSLLHDKVLCPVLGFGGLFLFECL